MLRISKLFLLYFIRMCAYTKCVYILLRMRVIFVCFTYDNNVFVRPYIFINAYSFVYIFVLFLHFSII